MIRRLILPMMTSLLILFGVSVPTLDVYAVDPLKQACDSDHGASTAFCGNANQESGRSLVFGNQSLLVKIIEFIVFLTAVVSVIMIFVGGLKYVLSSGDPNATKSAKDTIMYALIGLVIAVSCQAIVSFILVLFK